MLVILTVFRLVFEIPPTGGVFPDYHIYTVKLIHFAERWDYFMLGLSMTLTVYIVYFLLEEVRELMYNGTRHFFFVSSYVDIGICLVSSVVSVTKSVESQYRFHGKFGSENGECKFQNF